VIEKGIEHPSPHMHIGTMDRLQHWVHKAYSGKLIDENLELEER